MSRECRVNNLFLYAIVVLIWGSTWAAIPFQLGVVDHEHPNVAGAMQAIEFRNDAVAGTTARLHEDQQHLSAGISLKGEVPA